MPHTLKDKKQLLMRVRRIKGQAEALEKNLDQGSECSAVLQQIAAIRGAVNGLMLEVLEGHLRDHLGTHAGQLLGAWRGGFQVFQLAPEAGFDLGQGLAFLHVGCGAEDKQAVVAGVSVIAGTGPGDQLFTAFQAVR